MAFHRLCARWHQLLSHVSGSRLRSIGTASEDTGVPDVRFLAKFGIVLALAAFSRLTWAADVIHIPNFGQVNIGVYRGAEPSERALRDLAALHIKLVVDLREPSAATFRERVETERLGMMYRNVPFRPWSAPTPDQVQTVLALLTDKRASPVFLHCRRGKDRTGTVIACYRIEHDGWTNTRALSEAESYGMSSVERGMRTFVLHFSLASLTPHPD